MSSDDDCQRLLTLVAHELRSPGAVVVGYLRLLLKNTAGRLTEAEQKMLEEANRSCGRMLHIAQELSVLADLAGRDPIRVMSPLPIFNVCNEVVQAAADAGGKISFSVAEGDRSACVEGHAARLKQALGALVTVILREHGTVATTVSGAVSRGSDSRAVIVFGDVTNLADVLTHQDNAFDRWRGGTGLSLPIAHSIVAAHRGALWGLPGRPLAAWALSLPLLPA
jgi:signal transduction histidine kinase